MNSHPDVTERTWAAVAHLSILLTLVAGLVSGGAATLVGLLVPLIIYLAYQGRSQYVAFHALQALVFQAAAIVITLAGLAAAGLVLLAAWLITAALLFVLVGFLLLPLALVFTVALSSLCVLLPVGLAGYGVIGSYQTYSGEDFEYYRLGAIARRQIYGAAEPLAAR